MSSKLLLFSLLPTLNLAGSSAVAKSVSVTSVFLDNVSQNFYASIMTAGPSMIAFHLACSPGGLALDDCMYPPGINVTVSNSNTFIATYSYSQIMDVYQACTVPVADLSIGEATGVYDTVSASCTGRGMGQMYDEPTWVSVMQEVPLSWTPITVTGGFENLGGGAASAGTGTLTTTSQAVTTTALTTATPTAAVSLTSASSTGTRAGTTLAGTAKTSSVSTGEAGQLRGYSQMAFLLLGVLHLM